MSEAEAIFPSSAHEDPVAFSYPLRSFWGGWEGEIHVVVPMMNEERLRDLLVSQPTAALTTQVEELTAALRREGGLVCAEAAEGAHVVLSLLREFYPRASVHWSTTAQVLERDGSLKESCRQHNLVLIGGPVSNPVSEGVLSSGDLRYSFEAHQGQPEWWRTRSLAGLFPVWNGREIVVDYGLILKRPSPFAPNRRVVVLAGIRSLGSLGAASAACSARLANEVVAAGRAKGPGQAQAGAVGNECEHSDFIIKVVNPRGLLRDTDSPEANAEKADLTAAGVDVLHEEEKLVAVGVDPSEPTFSRWVRNDGDRNVTCELLTKAFGEIDSFLEQMWSGLFFRRRAPVISLVCGLFFFFSVLVLGGWILQTIFAAGVASVSPAGMACLVGSGCGLVAHSGGLGRFWRG